ncbi:MAG: hypothetical protein BAJALOKI2v1_280031 [Promethearchaeota archaeon]|nr:MAG: hypothetical protein BAJALOKI2v1_280031 [Candidatus Lokiarchaeota archaeon]
MRKILNKTSSESCCDSSSELPRIYIFPLTCTSCGTCSEVCPFGLPQKKNDTYEIVNPELCTQCSACMRNCPTNAIIMQEIKGCGCLWDVRKRKKSKSKGASNSCECGSC